MGTGRHGWRWGLGLGAGLIGAAVVALRLRGRGAGREVLPDVISPAIFARRVQATSRGQIVFHASGSGEPVLFLHDLAPGLASYEWSRVYPHFAASHRVLAIDWPGFGESERSARLLTAEDYSAALAEFARAVCGLQRPVVVASGVGASLACLAASQHPEFARRLVLFAPVGTRERLADLVPRRWRAAVWLPALRRSLYRSVLASPAGIRRWLQRAGGEADRGEAMAVLGSFARQYGAEHAVLHMLSGRLRVAMLEGLENVVVPVSIVQPGPELPGSAMVGREAVRIERMPSLSALAALDQPEALREVLAAELFTPLRVA